MRRSKVQCRNCGKTLPRTIRHCPYCGTPTRGIGALQRLKGGLHELYQPLVRRKIVLSLVGLGGIVFFWFLVSSPQPATQATAFSVSDTAQDEESEHSPTRTVYVPDEPRLLMPASSQRLLSESDTAGKNAEEIQLCINALYALRGFSYRIKSIREYFHEMSWYRPDTESMQTARDRMSAIERKNIDFLVKKKREIEERENTIVSTVDSGDEPPFKLLQEGQTNQDEFKTENF